MADQHQKRIAIIGAGISGLLACKYALSKGFQPTVFESQNGVGGVWRRTLSTTKLQNSKPTFQFSDFPWPDSVTVEFPTHNQVLDYLQAYADRFQLAQHIKFNAKVVGIDYRGVAEEEMEGWHLWGGNGEGFGCRGGRWEVEVAGTGSSESEVYEADFVVLCLGKFSDVPNFPQFASGQGPEAFQGKVIHSMEYSDLEAEEARNLVKGKRVTVVGFRKTALDIAMECSETNGKENPCRVLYRTERWSFPDWFPPLPYLCFTRFAELLIHKPGEGVFLSILATLLSPIRWAVSRLVESVVKSKHPLAKHGMIPKQSFLQDFSTCLLAKLPEKFYDRVEEGSIVLTKARNFTFCKEGIKVEDDQPPLETDLVILATGFKGGKKVKDIFGSKFFRRSETGGLPLYRQCIHPRIPQLAVLGYSESLSNLFTSEMRSRWLMELLDGKFKLPAIKEMEDDAAKWDGYFKCYGDEYSDRASISAIHIWHNDQLCKDMGWKPRRKHGLWAELFEPYGPMDYVCP
ncbi:unnamed protein product [Linum trigynum]|uniref:Flavin-containing monooxygenase n=1 Tax=Linum trigynum TaxID=586398 RepID=A0AAV2DGG0_9ROSI